MATAVRYARVSAAANASRELLWEALDATQDAIYLSTLEDPRIVDCNEGACRVLGYSREELLGAPTRIIFAEIDRAALEAQYGRLRDSDAGEERFETVHRRKDGSTFPVEIVRRVLRTPEGEFVLGIARSLGARRAAEAVLRESEARFRALTEVSTDWTWELDAELRFTRIDGAGLAALGIRAEEVVGRTALQVPNYTLLSPSREAFAAIRAAREPYQDVRGRFVLPDGSHHYVSISGTPRFGADGRFLGYRGVTRNITAQVRAEEALRESETRFRLLVESAPELLYFITDAERSQWFYNSPGLTALWGYEGSTQDVEAVRALQRRAVHPDDLAAFADRRTAEARGGHTDIEYRIEHPRTGQRWLRTRTRGVVQPDGSVRVYGITEDVTARKRAQLALRESEDRFRKIVESSPQIVFFISNPERTRWEYVSPSIRTLWGYRGSIADGEQLRSYLSEELAPEDRSIFFGRAEREARGELVDLSYRVALRGRGTRWLRTTSYGVRMPDRSVRVYGTTMDVTAEKTAEARLRELAATLEAKVGERTRELGAVDRELEALAYAVSHDMRTPLRAINSYAQLLASGEAAGLSDEGRRLLTRIEVNALAMGRQIDQVLAYSQATRRAMQRERVELGSVAQDAWRRLAPQYPGAAVAIGALGEIEGDAAMLRIVLYNLLENALKFSDPAAIEVEIGVTQHGGRREWFVRDRGVGFDPQYAGKLFTLFTRLHAGASYAGIGAGLAIAKRLVERHGGSIRADAAPLRGATFTFSLERTPDA